MSYVKGQIDKGDLAGKFVVLVVFDDISDAKKLAGDVSDPRDYKSLMTTVHEVIASHYDIDYNQHKLVLGPARLLDA